MPLGEQITRARERLGMSQAQLAKAAGLTRASISRIESNHLTNLTTESLCKLADVLGATIDELLGRYDITLAEGLLSGELRILRKGYEKLSAENRVKLRDFLNYLLFTQLQEEMRAQKDE